MDCIIVSDDIDCQPLILELVEQLLSLNLKPKVVLRQHLQKVVDESRHLSPMLFFNESTVRIDNPKMILDFHRSNRNFAIIRDSSGTTLSISPALVDFTNGEPILAGPIKDLSKIFTASNTSVTRKLLPVTPPHIILLSHNRHHYLELTLNSLLFSLRPNVLNVPITLALSAPTEAVIACAKRFQQSYSNINILQLHENTHMATTTFILNYWEMKQLLPPTFMVMEDDFILPSSIKDLYPNWPWWFANRLRVYDMVAWLPSLDNCPTAVTTYINHHNIKITRGTIPGSRWIDSSFNYNMAVSGNAVACHTKLYFLTGKRSSFGYPVDNELNALVANVSCPVVPGYHIGWNQEQDGHPKLDTRTWPIVPRITPITDLIRQETLIVSL